MARRPAALLLCLVFALLCVLPGFVAAEAETKTIRVGWYETPFNRKDSLGRVSRYIPTMLDYRTHIDKLSMFNTPPVFSIFVMNETLKWIKSIGGVEAIHKINLEKARILYSEIDRNPLFTGTAAVEDRSIMNVCFVMAPGREELQDTFLSFAKERGMVGIKGHRSVGGFRASLYNACSIADVEALVACMKEFEKQYA